VPASLWRERANAEHCWLRLTTCPILAIPRHKSSGYPLEQRERLFVRQSPADHLAALPMLLLVILVNERLTELQHLIMKKPDT
jgi:hypothetical protein